jgi:hypothetical protein
LNDSVWRSAILYLVPYQNQCPNCEQSGLVRVETIIKGGMASRAFYCGGCEHQWTIADPPKIVIPPLPPLPKPRTRSYGPKRRG